MLSFPTKTLFVASLLLFAFPADGFAQKRDPFSTPDSRVSPTGTKSAKYNKVVVHTPTLDLCFDWFEMNMGLVKTQSKIAQTRKAISAAKQANEAQDKWAKLEEQLAQLEAVNHQTKTRLNRIPWETTFDLERWEKFKQQLESMRVREFQKMEWVEFRNREIDQLRVENQKLRDEIARLRGGDNHR